MTATSFEVNPNLSTSSNSLVNPNGTNNDGLSGNQTAITQQIQLSHQQTHGGFLVPNSPSSSSSTSKNNGDTTFEPTVDMMVNDFDDEQTLEEEEALAAREAEDPSAELSNLQKESDMPIEELLALYNCTSSVTSNNGTELSGTSNSNDKCSTSGNSCTSLSNMNTKNNNNNGGNSHTINSNSINNGNNQNPGKLNSATSSLITVPSGGGRRIITTTATTGGKTTTGTVTGLSSTNSINHHDDNGGATEPNGENDDDEDLDEDDEVEVDEDDDDEFDDDESKEPPSQLRKLYPETYGNASDKRLLRTISRQQSDEEDEGDYSPDEDEFKKTIMVGSEFQAMIPEGFFKYDDVLPYENEDKLLWDPSRLSEQQTEEYLQKANQAKLQNQTSIVESIPQGHHLKDDEQALYLLLQCGHNTDEALRRKRINAVPISEQMMSLWSEEECRNFESGIRIYGKDFHTIKHAKVRTRSVGELVQFYYLWKKTERHDVFANKARLEKKKYSLHPGLTDYMDRFLEEQDCNNCTTNHTNVNLRDRSLSPGANNSLLMADTKRISTLQHHHHHHQHQQMQQQQQQNAHIVNKSLNPGGNIDYSIIAATTAGSSSTTPANQMQDPLAVGDAEVFTGIKTLNNSSNSIINNKVTQQQHQQQQHIDSPTSSGSGSLSSLNADHNDTPDQ